MSKKWYNYIVSVDDAAGNESDPTNVPPNTKNAPATARSAAQSVAEIASSIAAGAEIYHSDLRSDFV